MAGWLKKLAIHRAVRRFAKLPSDLRSNYGASKFYTRGQIDAAIKRQVKNPRFVALAYAVFLTEEEFKTIAIGAPLEFGYDEARGIVERA